MPTRFALLSLCFALAVTGCKKVPNLLKANDQTQASAAEQARGNDYEFRGLKNPVLRTLLRVHRRFVWLHRPFDHNHLLDKFVKRAKECDYVVVNGDYSCDSAYCGIRWMEPTRGACWSSTLPEPTASASPSTPVR